MKQPLSIARAFQGRLRQAQCSMKFLPANLKSNVLSPKIASSISDRNLIFYCLLQLRVRKCNASGFSDVPFTNFELFFCIALSELDVIIHSENVVLFNNLWKVYTNWNLAYTTRQGSRVSCLAQTGFAAFVKGVQLISGPPYAETEQLSRLTSPSGILATSWW